jgi:hypothetical protein
MENFDGWSCKQVVCPQNHAPMKLVRFFDDAMADAVQETIQVSLEYALIDAAHSGSQM